jgi:hypothetical protein
VKKGWKGGYLDDVTETPEHGEAIVQSTTTNHKFVYDFSDYYWIIGAFAKAYDR